MRCFNSSCCGKEVLLATIKDSVETLSEFPATNTINSIFCRQNNWHFWLANHRTSCRTSGAIQPKSEKLRYRTDNCYWVRPKANGERSIVTMGYSYYTMLHFISLWSVIWSVLVILIKTMGKVHSSNTVKLNVWCFSRKPWTRVSFSTKKIKITLLGLLDRLQKILDGQHCRFQ